MKRYLLPLTLSVLVSFKSQAQLKGFSIGPYAEMIWPAGNTANTYSTAVGGGLNADIRIQKFGVSASAGFIHIGGKTVAVNEGTAKTAAINAIPVRVGIKYRFVPALYFKVEGGVARYVDDAGSAVIFSPGIGVRVLGLDVQAKYETWIDKGSGWGLKVAYNF